MINKALWHTWANINPAINSYLFTFLQIIWLPFHLIIVINIISCAYESTICSKSISQLIERGKLSWFEVICSWYDRQKQMSCVSRRGSHEKPLASA